MRNHPSLLRPSFALLLLLIAAPGTGFAAEGSSVEASQASTLANRCGIFTAPVFDLATQAMTDAALALQCNRNRPKGVSSDKDACGTGPDGECTSADFANLLQMAYTEARGKCGNRPAVTCSKASCLQDCVLTVSYNRNTSAVFDANCARPRQERCFLSLGGVCECSCPAWNLFAVSFSTLDDRVLRPTLERLPPEVLERPELSTGDRPGVD